MTDADRARRIFGLETEYGVQHWNPQGRPLSPEEVVRYLFRPVAGVKGPQTHAPILPARGNPGTWG